MGEVYRAVDTRLDSTVAIKFIRVEALEGGMGAEILARFRREAQVLASLAHPHIVKVIDYGVHDQDPYLVTDFVPGGTLVDRGGQPIPWTATARLLEPIARALDYAHRQGVVHRDLKPANILLSEDGQPVLADFGIAKLIGAAAALSPTALSQIGSGIGTPAYMSPEQARGQPLDGRSDVYSLGVMTYELLTGQRPFSADDAWALMEQQISARPPAPRRWVRDLPAAVERLVLRMLAKDPDQRPTMAEVAAQLARAATPGVERPAWLSCLGRSVVVLALGGGLLGIGSYITWQWMLDQLEQRLSQALPPGPVIWATFQSANASTAGPTATAPVGAPTATPRPDWPDVFGSVDNSGWQSTVGATIMARRDTDGLTRTTTVGSEHDYLFVDLQPGSWTIEVRGDGLFVSPVPLVVETYTNYQLSLRTYDRLTIGAVHVGDGSILRAEWAAYKPAAPTDVKITVAYRCELWLNGRAVVSSEPDPKTACQLAPNTSTILVFGGDLVEVRVMALTTDEFGTTATLTGIGSTTTTWP